MKNKKNKSGFTLVELVVVMSIMGIILGAILNLLEPVNTAYRNAESVTNTNQVGSGLNEWIEEQVRYSTNVLVLSNYEGVPQVTNGKVGSHSAIFNDCIILDNTNVRGSQFDDYDATATVSRKMGATGTLLHVKNLKDYDTFSFKEIDTGMEEEYYGNEAYNFEAGIVQQSTDGVTNLRLTTTAFQYSLRNGSYVFDEKQRFTSEKEFDLVNINVDPSNPKFIAKEYDFATSPDYTKFPKATVKTATNAVQSAMYNKDSVYTYIFYTKSTEDPEVNVTFTYETSTGAKKTDTLIIKKGSTLNSGLVPDPSLPSKYESVQWSTTVEDGGIFPITFDWKQKTFYHDTAFEALYGPKIATTWYKAKFVNVDGTPAADITDGSGYVDIPAGSFVFNTVDNSNLPGELDTHSSKYDADYASKHSFVGWYTMIGGVKKYSTEVTLDNDTTVFYPEVKQKPKVTFEANGAAYSTEQYVEYDALATAPVDEPTPPADNKIFAGWYKKTTGESIESYKVTSDTVFVAKFEDKPNVSGSLNIVSVQYNSNLTDHYATWASGDNYYYAGAGVNFGLQNNSASAHSGPVKIKIKFNKNIADESKFTVATNEGGGTITRSGDTLTVTYNGSMSAYQYINFNIKLEETTATKQSQITGDYFTVKQVKFG